MVFYRSSFISGYGFKILDLTAFHTLEESHSFCSSTVTLIFYIVMNLLVYYIYLVLFLGFGRHRIRLRCELDTGSLVCNMQDPVP